MERFGEGVSFRSMTRGAIKARRMRAEDIPAVVACERACYQDYARETLMDARNYELQLSAFAEGQFVVEKDGKIVGYATSLIVQLDGLPHEYTYAELTGSATFSTHDPQGDTLYGADIAVHPDHRGQGIAAKLYDARMTLLRRFNLRRMLAFGRIPGYAEWAGRLTAREYVDKVIAGELRDSALRAHLKAGYRVESVRLDFMLDHTSHNYSTQLVYDNPDFDLQKRRIAASPIARPVRKIRVAAAQWLMRPGLTRAQFDATLGFFAESADVYHCHFLVLPELFTVQTFTSWGTKLESRKAMDRLADEYEPYRARMLELAQQHQLYLLGGSHPVREGNKLYNRCHLFSPTGGVYTQDKLHLTPVERELWGFSSGEGLKVFDTAMARVSALVCYDIEFPELARLMTLAGSTIIFVPFSTDEKQAYWRVRHSAQARAVENSIYVVMAGNAGNLPMSSCLLNYARSAILTPCDFGFPQAGVAAEADPNVETVVTADLDLAALDQHRDAGSVRVLHDRRADLYEVRAKSPIERVIVE